MFLKKSIHKTSYKIVYMPGHKRKSQFCHYSWASYSTWVQCPQTRPSGSEVWFRHCQWASLGPDRAHEQPQGATRQSFQFSFQFFLCVKQGVCVNHLFLLRLSFPPFPSTVIKQGHVCNILGILPKFWAHSKTHEPVQWSTWPICWTPHPDHMTPKLNFLNSPGLLPLLLESLLLKKETKDIFSPSLLHLLNPFLGISLKIFKYLDGIFKV